MANVQPQAQQSPGLFSFLVGKLGLSGALQLLAVLNPDANAVQKAFGATQLGQTALQGYNLATGSPAASKAAGALGPALAGAGLGYGIFNIASNPNLSTGQKAGHSAHAATDATLSAAVPYYGLAKVANLLGKQLETSGSPQLRSLGRFTDSATMPSGLERLWSVIQGDKSPAAAFQTRDAWDAAAKDTMNALAPGSGAILSALGIRLPGLYSEPTTGTKMRDEIARVAGRIPELKGFKPIHNALTTDQYNAYSKDQQNAAYALSAMLGNYSKDFRKNPEAYQIQIGNSLLKQYGPGIIDMASQIFSGQPGSPTVPQMGQMTVAQGKSALPPTMGERSTQFSVAPPKGSLMDTLTLLSQRRV